MFSSTLFWYSLLGILSAILFSLQSPVAITDAPSFVLDRLAKLALSPTHPLFDTSLKSLGASFEYSSLVKVEGYGSVVNVTRASSRLSPVLVTSIYGDHSHSLAIGLGYAHAREHVLFLALTRVLALSQSHAFLGAPSFSREHLLA